MIDEQNLLARAKAIEQLFRSRLTELAAECDQVREVRAVGCMIGLELIQDGAAVVKGCLERRLLINCTHGTVIRLLPALTLTDEEAHQGCDILCDVMKGLQAN